jgi:hypothetical protein
MLPDVAVIFAVCPDTAVETTVASPAELIVATALLSEAHVTEVVITLVDPSELCPVATYCWVLLIATVAVVGVTTILVNVGPTVTADVPEIVPTAACTVAVPVNTPFTTPFGATSLTVAAPVGLLAVTDQAADPVRSFVELSLYVPVATSVVVDPTATVVVDGVTAIELSFGSVKKFLQPAPVKMSATNAKSAGQALRIGKKII